MSTAKSLLMLSDQQAAQHLAPELDRNTISLDVDKAVDTHCILTRFCALPPLAIAAFLAAKFASLRSVVKLDALQQTEVQDCLQHQE